jgi:HlyD family secretion protein
MKNYSIMILASIFLFASCSEESEMKYIEESGNIEVTNIMLSSHASGKVVDIYVDEGDQVEEGATLLIIDHELLKIQLKQANAGMRAAKAQLDLVITGARKEDVSLATEQLTQANTNFESAKTDFERMKNLFDEQAITKKQFDDAETRITISKSQLVAAQENLNKIKNISRPEEITQTRSNFEKAEANVELIKKQIKDSHIISPLNGIVVDKFVEIGESVNYGSSIFKISDLSIVELVVYINEENLGKVKLGQATEVYTDTYKEKVYKGKVIYISPEAEFTPKNIQTKDERTKLVFAVKIELPNPDFELKAGMPADAKIKIED